MVERAHRTGTFGALRAWRRWPEWLGYAAAVWSLIYGALGLWRALGGQPHGVPADQEAFASLSPRCPVFRIEVRRPGANYSQTAEARKGNA